MHVLTDLGTPAPVDAGTAISIGAYDGVHLGHQAVIASLQRWANERDWKTAVVTFDKHPASIVRPESAPPLLTDLDQKLELLDAAGVDVVVVIRFDERRAEEEPEHFVRTVLVETLKAKAVIVGTDFHFGRHRRGNVPMLEALGSEYGFEVHGLELVERNDGIDEPVSSTAIRRALAGGAVEAATRMLGRPHQVRGDVVVGDRRGRTLGFPTANVEVPNAMCLPADGVYAGFYQRPNGERFACAINLGRRPTFYEHADRSLLEAHLLDWSGDLYGEHCRVEFTHFLRSERKFEGIDALVKQLKMDVDHAREATSNVDGKLAAD